MPPNELEILSMVNRKRLILFNELPYPGFKKSKIVRRLAAKGLVNLYVARSHPSKKKNYKPILVSGEEQRAQLEAMLRNASLLKKAYSNYLKELQELSRVIPNKIKEVPSTLEEFRQICKQRYTSICKSGLPEKNMKVLAIQSTQKGLLFEKFVRKELSKLLEKTQNGVSALHVFGEIIKFREECYGRFNQLFIETVGLEHGEGNRSGNDTRGGKSSPEQANTGEAQ